jgi:4-amino-4-deoxy-L-arabinose transferase-like glycosyltransferase
MNGRLASVPAPVWVALITILCVAPFGGSAFKVDDTLFLRAAEQIRHHPTDFYGFSMNWIGVPLPMYKDADNPPLASYLIALASLIGGWSEWSLHSAFALVAAAAAAGCWFLAARFCRHPTTAALVAVLSPVFLVSATTVMCDTMLLAFWVWSLYCLERGLEEKRPGFYWLAGVLAGLATLTKFPGLALCPLFVAYALVRHRRLGWWVVAPALPVLTVAAYEWYTHALYGRGLFTAAMAYTAQFRTIHPPNPLDKFSNGVVFLGGCYLPALFYAPWLRLRCVAVYLPVAFLAVGILIPAFAPAYHALVLPPDHGFAFVAFAQMEVFILAGVFVLALLVLDCLERRDEGSLLLALWAGGIFVFSAGFNWTVNGRSLLPMAPAVGLLLARRIELGIPLTIRGEWRSSVIPAVAAAMVSLCVVAADCHAANKSRRDAAALWGRYSHPRTTLWFEGHWGLQYYLEGLGAMAADITKPAFGPDDLFILPNHQSNVYPPLPGAAKLVEVSGNPGGWQLTTFSTETGVSFYAANLGPLPFAVALREPDRYLVYRLP